MSAAGAWVLAVFAVVVASLYARGRLAAGAPIVTSIVALALATALSTGPRAALVLDLATLAFVALALGVLLLSWETRREPLEPPPETHWRALLPEAALVGALALLPLTWFTGGMLVSHGDFGFPLDRLQYMEATWHAWDSRFSTGTQNPLQTMAIPFGLLAGLSAWLGVPLVRFEQALFVVWFAAAGLSMLVLAWAVGAPRVGRVAAAVAYMLNPFSLVLVWQVGQGVIQLPYALVPLFLGLFIHGVRLGKGWRYALGLSALWFGTTFLSPNANLLYPVLQWAPILAYAAFASAHGLTGRSWVPARRALRLLAPLMLFFVLFNAYWLVLVAAGWRSLAENAATVQSFAYIPNLQTFALNSAPLVDAFRLMGYWALGGDALPGHPYYSFGAAMLEPAMVALQLLVPLVALYGLRRLPPTREHAFLGALAVVGIFLLTGVNAPSGPVNVWLFTHVAGFQAFRNGMVAFGILTAPALIALFGLGVAALAADAARVAARLRAGRASRAASWGVATVLALLVSVVAVHPMWTGDVVQDEGSPTLSARMAEPGDYPAFRKWDAGEAPLGRVLVLPLPRGYNVALDWPQGYVGPEPLMWHSDRQVIFSRTTPLYETLVALGNDPAAVEPEALRELMALLHVELVVLHEDANWTLAAGDANADAARARTAELLERAGAERVECNASYCVYRLQGTGAALVHAAGRVARTNAPTGEVVPRLLEDPEWGADDALLLDRGDAWPAHLRVDEHLPVPSRPGAFATLVLPERTTFEARTRNVTWWAIDEQPQPVTHAVPLVVTSSSRWSQEGDAPDAFVPGPQARLLVDASVPGQRAIVAEVEPRALGDSLVVSLFGDGTPRTLIVQPYDEEGRFLSWSVTTDWTGWRELNLTRESATVNARADFGRLRAVSLFTTPEGNESYRVAWNMTSLATWTREVPSPPERVTLDAGRHVLYGEAERDAVLGGVLSLLRSPPEDALAAPRVTYERQGPAEFKVHAGASDAPFVLTLDESYDAGWRLYRGDVGPLRALATESLGAPVMANAYANAWLLAGPASDYTLLYLPQAYLALGMLVTGAWLVACAAGLVVVRARARR